MTTKDRAKFSNLKRDPSLSLIVDDVATHKYVAAYGRAKIVERDFAEHVRPILEKYVPAGNVEQRLKAVTDDPSRVLVVLHPDRIVTN